MQAASSKPPDALLFRQCKAACRPTSALPPNIRPAAKQAANARRFRQSSSARQHCRGQLTRQASSAGAQT